MIVLTSPMARDLRFIVALHNKTVCSYDYPKGLSHRLRTGRALQRRGLVYLANKNTANAYARWSPTDAGIRHVAENFCAGVDPFRNEAQHKATTAMARGLA